MRDTTLDWELIEEAARSYGIRPGTLQKWRSRKSVPHRWRVLFLQHSKGLISIDAFDNPPAREARP